MTITKKILVIIFLLNSLFVFSDEYVLTFDEITTSMSGPKRTSDKGIKKKKSRSNNNSALKKELKEANELLESYRYMAKNQLRDPIIMMENVVEEADIIGGSNSLTIRATSVPTPTVVTNLKGTDLPSDAKIVCNIYTKYKRVCGRCNRLIINGEGHDIDASLYNRDGSNCAIGELSDDGESYLVGIGITEMVKGAAALSQSSIPTVGGNIIEASAKNKILQGLINTSDEATDLMKDQFETKEPIVLIKRNSNLAIYFNKGVKL